MTAPQTIHRRRSERIAPIIHSAVDALRDERGSVTAEYAIATLAAVGFAGLLVVILRGDEVRAMLTDLIHHALTAAG